MSKKFLFKDGKEGYEGVVSDAVAVILEKKGAGKIVGEAAKPAPKQDEAKK